jgi:hypothetical protein
MFLWESVSAESLSASPEDGQDGGGSLGQASYFKTKERLNS